MPKDPDPKPPRPARPSGSQSSQASRSQASKDKGNDDSQELPRATPPPLVWAKWVERLTTERKRKPEEKEGEGSTPEARLREATEAAQRAREERVQDRPKGARAAKPGPPVAPPAPAARPARPAAPPRRPEPAPSPKAPPPAPAPPPHAQPPQAQPPHAQPPQAQPLAVADEPLPHGYGEDRITLICKDPYWVHAYWEITKPNQERAWQALGHATAYLALRVYHYSPSAPDASEPEGFFDLDIEERARNWYVHAGRPGAAFEVEIGLKAADGRFVPLARSHRVATPRDRMSDVLDEQWLSLVEEYEQMYALSGGYRTGGGSLELAELMARRLGEMMGSGAVSSFGLQVSSFGASEALIAQRQAPRSFWFVLGTELIVYGATEPDATVTCQGHPVALRPDGTFTLRFALPDGAQHIPCAAISRDRVDTITITPHVEKTTTHEEQRGASEESP